tara:strand:+ start:58 stop:309 length:252 start_codon:yes stop_codon:yes gene_type:complete
MHIRGTNGSRVASLAGGLVSKPSRHHALELRTFQKYTKPKKNQKRTFQKVHKTKKNKKIPFQKAYQNDKKNTKIKKKSGNKCT